MEAFTVERRGRIASEAERAVRRTFRYTANAQGECDTCHREPRPVYREDSDAAMPDAPIRVEVWGAKEHIAVLMPCRI